MRATDKQIKQALAEGKSQRQIVSELHVGQGRISRLRNRSEKPVVEVSAATGGFSLKGKTVLAKKPTDIWRPRFRALQKGLGYELQVLSEQWGVGADTIKNKARRHGCLRWVEQDDGIYVACVVHPETQGGK